jgi:hypothetical protein
LDAFAAVVHECARFCQDHLVPGDPALTQHSLGSPVIQTYLGLFCEEIDEPESYIVPGGGVSSAGIPKANNKEHV